MGAQPAEALPALWPTVPGCVDGIVSLSPAIIQCRECGVTDTCESVGLPSKAGERGELAIVVILSDIRFHPRTWDDGRTDNPRLCRPCRLARGCTCQHCNDERKSR